MSIHEYVRRNEMQERRAESLLARPTPPLSGPDILEEQAQILVELALSLRENARLIREQLAQRERAA